MLLEVMVKDSWDHRASMQEQHLETMEYHDGGVDSLCGNKEHWQSDHGSGTLILTRTTIRII